MDFILNSRESNECLLDQNDKIQQENNNRIRTTKYQNYLPLIGLPITGSGGAVHSYANEA